MTDERNLIPGPAWPEILRKIRARTPARIFVGRGPAYDTRMEVELRSAHARAVDAVWTEFDLQKDLPPDFITRWELFQVSTQVESKAQFLLRPDLGRKLTTAARELISQRCRPNADLQIVIGDGLSGAAVSSQVPALFALLEQKAQARGWSLGRAFAVRYCRVGIMNDIGDVLAPRVLVLLIGERPGLATAESLSAYMAFQPQTGHTDANRNLISNIHHRGVQPAEAADRISNLAAKMMMLGRSGTAVKEEKAQLPE